ncbi:hypothetical protein SAMN06272771_0127 [Streptomyces sp. Ag82_O1-12]|uniref:hypothetical protein n=1 Tax=unclassified Streptomyces TaxID=2593676 RepID=UPI000BCE6F0C|nr:MULTISPECIES: hypothetical protein [unclassified Streptomyces]SMQ13850.1 hypothetical protein SAMN06272771_0127 [Streptomyces sp. Ag82_O1-12]SOD42880.1 hypothetical protein SAMN06272727_0117 [Streptomyces sp. Ag82_G6-1]
MASPPADDQGSPAPARRERPSRLIDVGLAVLLLVADAVIVVVAGLLFVAVGMGAAHAPHSSRPVQSSDTPVLVWFVVWGVPAVAAVGAFVYARLRMPVTAVVQSLFTLVCGLLAVAWTRMLLS